MIKRFFLRNRIYLLSAAVLLFVFVTNLVYYCTTGQAQSWSGMSAVNILIINVGPLSEMGAVIAITLPLLAGRQYRKSGLETLQSGRKIWQRFRFFLQEALKISLSMLLASVFCAVLCFLAFSGNIIAPAIEDFGLFGSVRLYTPFLYFLLFLLYSFLFHTLFALFAQGVYWLVRNKALTPVICVLSYYNYVFIPSSLGLLHMLLPFAVFNFMGYDISLAERIWNLVFLLLLALLLLSFARDTARKKTHKQTGKA